MKPMSIVKSNYPTLASPVLIRTKHNVGKLLKCLIANFTPKIVDHDAYFLFDNSNIWRNINVAVVTCKKDFLSVFHPLCMKVEATGSKHVCTMGSLGSIVLSW